MTPAAATLLVGDALTRLAELPANSVQVVVTSPPFFNLRDYGTGTWIGGDPACDHKPGSAARVGATTLGGGTATSGHQQEGYRHICAKCGATRADAQLGQEATLDCAAWATGQPGCGACYVCHLVAVFREVKRVLRPDGCVFLNLGDSYASNNGGPKPVQTCNPKRKGGSDTLNAGASRRVGAGLKPKDLCLAPARVALALQADGWWVRSEIVWGKKAPLPESVQDRPTRSHEIYLLTKSAHYYFDADAIKTPAKTEHLGRYAYPMWQAGTREATGSDRPDARSNTPNMRRQTSANLRDVWTLGPEGNSLAFCAACHTLYTAAQARRLAADYTGARICACGASDRWVAHYASFPTEIARRAILAGSSQVGACAKCGSPWRRVVERGVNPYPGSSHNHATDATQGNVGVHASGIPAGTIMANRWYAKTPDTTIGWAPQCQCPGLDGDSPWPDVAMHPDGAANWPVVPCTALDPFVGSGTTAIVAQELGRAVIAIDLRADYIALTRARLAQANAPARTRRAASPAAQPRLLEWNHAAHPPAG